MPFPVMAAAQIGTSLLGSLLGASAQSKQLRLQREQFAFQQQQAQAQLELAKEAARMGKASQMDAAGNLTIYDEATNSWKTVLSADQQQLLDSSERESLLQLTRDASLSRGERETAARDRVGARETAGAVKSQIDDQIAGRSGYNAGDLESSLRLSRERAVSQGFDDVSNTLSTQAMRSGSGNLDQIGRTLANARSQAIAQQMGDPRTEAMAMAGELNRARMGGNAQLYNMFNTTSNNPNAVAPGVSTGVDSTSLNAVRSAAASGLNAAGNLNNNAAGISRSAVAPMNNTMGEMFSGLSNLAASPAGDQIGSYISGLFNRRGQGNSVDSLGTQFSTPISNRRGF